MRVFTAFLAHETNSFSPIPTSLASFEELGIYRPSMGLPANNSEYLKGAAHFYDEAQRRGDHVSVGLCALAQPSNLIKRTDYETIRDDLLDDLRAAANDGIDLVLLMMHGSMMAEGYDDCEGDILGHCRDMLGKNVIIGALLDLHCNVTPKMLENANIIKACKEYPHTDFDDRARELYDLCARIHEGTISPTVGFVRVPMLGLYQTSVSPMREFVDAILVQEKEPSILSITLAHGFPWSDFPDAGASVIVVTDDNQGLADEVASNIAAEFFALREEGQAQLLNADDSIELARSNSAGTVVIADMADNPGGGAASDSTFILKTLLDKGIRDAAIAYIWDPSSVDLAFAAGEGATIPMKIGGKVSHFSGDPISVNATITSLKTDASQLHISDGSKTMLGRTAVVTAQGIDIVLNDVRQQPFSPEGLISAGLAPWTKKILVLKSTHHFYARFHKNAARIIYCDAQGTLNSNVVDRPYRRIRRPIWPLDDIDTIHPLSDD